MKEFGRVLGEVAQDEIELKTNSWAGSIAIMAPRLCWIARRNAVEHRPQLLERERVRAAQELGTHRRLLVSSELAAQITDETHYELAVE
jgi:hypothetical protein